MLVTLTHGYDLGVMLVTLTHTYDSWIVLVTLTHAISESPSLFSKQQKGSIYATW